jgi:hypothetical protein
MTGADIERPTRTTVPAAGAVAAGLLVTAAGWGADGRPGLLAGLLATVVVLVFFWTGALPLLAASHQPAGVGLLLLMVTYGMRLTLALVVLAVAARSGSVDTGWVGSAVVATALTWCAVHVAVVMRALRT